MTPVRIQLSRRAGSRLEATSRAVNGLPARKVDRTKPFGNQFRMGRGTTEERAIVVSRYRAWLMSAERDARYMRRKIRLELAGHNVACGARRRPRATATRSWKCCTRPSVWLGEPHGMHEMHVGS